MYKIRDDQLGKVAAKFFYLEPETGIMSVRRPLNRTDADFPASSVFQFTILAEDQVPVNKKTGEASVSITVTSGDSDRPPVFDLQLYSTEITENYNINSTVINTRARDPDNNGQVCNDSV